MNSSRDRDSNGWWENLKDIIRENLIRGIAELYSD